MLDNTPAVSIVVPALNEARNLELVLPALPDVHEVILVDGGSVDDTIETARRVRPGIVVLQQTRRGKGNALVCGFEAATGDIIVMFDADGSADPAEIPAFVRALVEGADFAKGSRFCAGPGGTGSSEDITALRRAGNSGLNMLANVLFRTSFSDLCYGYNAFWRRILPVLHLPAADLPASPDGAMRWGDGFEIESVLSCRVAAAGLRVTEVASSEKRRAYGETNLRTFADGFRVLRTIVAERVGALRAAVPAGLPAPVALASTEAPEIAIADLATADLGDAADSQRHSRPVDLNAGRATAHRTSTLRHLGGNGGGPAGIQIAPVVPITGDAQVPAARAEGNTA